MEEEKEEEGCCELLSGRSDDDDDGGVSQRAEVQDADGRSRVDRPRTHTQRIRPSRHGESADITRHSHSDSREGTVAGGRAPDSV